MFSVIPSCSWPYWLYPATTRSSQGGRFLFRERPRLGYTYVGQDARYPDTRKGDLFTRSLDLARASSWYLPQYSRWAARFFGWSVPCVNACSWEIGFDLALNICGEHTPKGSPSHHAFLTQLDNNDSVPNRRSRGIPRSTQRDSRYYGRW